MFSKFAIEKSERVYRKLRKTQITIEFGEIIYRKTQKYKFPIISEGQFIGNLKNAIFRYSRKANVSENRENRNSDTIRNIKFLLLRDLGFEGAASEAGREL